MEFFCRAIGINCETNGFDACKIGKQLTDIDLSNKDNILSIMNIQSWLFCRKCKGKFEEHEFLY